MHEGRVLAIWLSLSYAHTNKHTNFLPSSLKGADMSLYENARGLGLKCLLVPFITFGGYYSDEEHIVKGLFYGFNEVYSGDGFSFDEYGTTCWGKLLDGVDDLLVVTVEYCADVSAKPFQVTKCRRERSHGSMTLWGKARRPRSRRRRSNARRIWRRFSCRILR